MDNVDISFAVEIGGVIFDLDSEEDCKTLKMIDFWNGEILSVNRNPQINGSVETHDPELERKRKFWSR